MSTEACTQASHQLRCSVNAGGIDLREGRAAQRPDHEGPEQMQISPMEVGPPRRSPSELCRYPIFSRIKKRSALTAVFHPGGHAAMRMILEAIGSGNGRGSMRTASAEGAFQREGSHG